MLDAQTRMLTEEPLQGFPLMGGGVIQENDEGAAHVPQQLTQEHADFLLGDVVVKQEVVEAQPLAAGADRDSGYYRNLIAASLAMT